MITIRPEKIYVLIASSYKPKTIEPVLLIITEDRFLKHL